MRRPFSGLAFLIIIGVMIRVSAWSDPVVDVVPLPHIPHVFSSVLNPYFKDSQNEYLRYWEVLKRPNGGLIGHVRLTGTTEPLEVRIRVHAVLPKDLYLPVIGAEKPKWFQPMGLVREDARLRTLTYQYSERVMPGDALVPIYLPADKPGEFRCLLEVVNEDGEAVFSAVPAELYSTQVVNYYGENGTTWIQTDEEEADHRTSLIGFENSLEYPVLPEEWDAYTEMDALWINADTPISERLLRQLVLSGHWILGGEGQLDDFAAALDITPHHRILFGGMVEVGSGGAKNGFQINNRDRPIYDFHNAYFSYYNNGEIYPLENSHNLFASVRKPILTYTLFAAGIFALCSTILVPRKFRRLRGAQLVSLWWKTPLIIALYALVIFIIGWFVVFPRLPIADITEYRLGYGDWPEVFCNVNATAFQYGQGEFGWQVTEGARDTFVPGQGEYNPRILKTRLVEANMPENENARVEHILGVRRGQRIHQGFGYFRDGIQPFSITRTGDVFTIHSSRDVRGLHVLVDDDHWVELGDVAAGGSIRFSQESNRGNIVGIPRTLCRGWEAFKTDSFTIKEGQKDKELCPNCRTYHSSGELIMKIANDSLVLFAVDAEDVPTVSSVVPSFKTSKRVVWISQVPVIAVTPQDADAPVSTSGEGS